MIDDDGSPLMKDTQHTCGIIKPEWTRRYCRRVAAPRDSTLVMASGLDMSLDDMIKRDRASGGKGGKARPPSGARHKGARKDAAPYARSSNPAFKACNNCGEIGHLAGKCLAPAQCHACGSTEHAVAMCPHKDKTCDICGKVGHLKSKCRLEARKAASSAPKPPSAVPSAAGKRCNNCGVIGHLAGQCPEPAQCHACGSTAHAVAACPHKDKVCDICGKIGHLKAKCRAAERM